MGLCADIRRTDPFTLGSIYTGPNKPNGSSLAANPTWESNEGHVTLSALTLATKLHCGEPHPPSGASVGETGVVPGHEQPDSD